MIRTWEAGQWGQFGGTVAQSRKLHERALGIFRDRSFQLLRSCLNLLKTKFLLRLLDKLNSLLSEIIFLKINLKNSI